LDLQSILQLLTSLVAHLGVNAIPAGLFWWGGTSAATTLVLYILETPLAVLLGALRVRILAPGNDNAYLGLEARPLAASASLRTPFRNRRELMVYYVAVSLGLCLIFGLWIAWLLFLLHMPLTGSAIASAMSGIIAFQLFSFVADLILMGRITAAQAEAILLHNMRRAGLIALAGVLGFIVANINPADITWFVTPFVVMRTGGDMLTTFLSFRARRVAPTLNVKPPELQGDVTL
jgi:hypothetical protein